MSADTDNRRVRGHGGRATGGNGRGGARRTAGSGNGRGGAATQRASDGAAAGAEYRGKSEGAAPAAARLPHRRRRPGAPAGGAGTPRMKVVADTRDRRARKTRRRPVDRPWHVRTSRRRTFRSVLRDLDPALPHGVDDGLGAVVDGELAQDARHVVLDGLLRDGERVGDLLVRHALGDVVQDLDFTR
jgi:hypothetical protein